MQQKVAESAAQVAESAADKMSRHFDGRASLLHADLAIFRTRHVEVKVAESAGQVAESAADKWNVLPQSADSFYMGNMCVEVVCDIFSD